MAQLAHRRQKILQRKDHRKLDGGRIDVVGGLGAVDVVVRVQLALFPFLVA
jgi:hypothetical protein